MTSIVKTRVFVQTEIRKAVLSCLSAYGYGGVQCLEYGQSAVTSAYDSVYVNHVSTETVGFQSSAEFTDPDTGITYNKREWIEEQTWQLHVLTRKEGSDVYSEDVADALVSWFNGEGIFQLRNVGVAPLRVHSEAVSLYSDDSETFRKRAVVTLKVQVPQRRVSEIPSISNIDGTIHKV